MLYNFNNYYSNLNLPRTGGKYDAHKKDELRTLYNEIVKLNKVSPFYLIQMEDGFQNNTIAIKEHARELKNAIRLVSENENSTTFKMFNDKILTSSDESVVTSTYLGLESEINHAPALTIEVEQLACNQINKGYYIYANSSALPVGTYSFQVNIAGANYEFEYSVKEKEKNEDILSRISNMINKANIGILATIETNEALDKIRLSLSSTTTGTASFSDVLFKIFEPTNSSTGTLTYFGFDQIYQKPLDSKFTINGIARTSSSNVFTVNKLYELYLQRTTETDEQVTISFQNDKKSTFQKITSFVDSYNDMIAYASNAQNEIKKSSKLLAEIGSIAVCYKSELDSMGLLVQNNYSITIDEASLFAAIDKEDAEFGTFASFRSFRNPLSRKIDNILLNPMEYILRTIITYPNTESISYANVYAISKYSGLLFNNYC